MQNNPVGPGTEKTEASPGLCNQQWRLLVFVAGICTALAASKYCSHQKCTLKIKMLFKGIIFQGTTNDKSAS